MVLASVLIKPLIIKRILNNEFWADIFTYAFKKTGLGGGDHLSSLSSTLNLQQLQDYGQTNVFNIFLT